MEYSSEGSVILMCVCACVCAWHKHTFKKKKERKVKMKACDLMITCQRWTHRVPRAWLANSICYKKGKQCSLKELLVGGVLAELPLSTAPVTQHSGPACQEWVSQGEFSDSRDWDLSVSLACDQGGRWPCWDGGKVHPKGWQPRLRSAWGRLCARGVVTEVVRVCKSV